MSGKSGWKLNPTTKVNFGGIIRPAVDAQNAPTAVLVV